METPRTTLLSVVASGFRTRKGFRWKACRGALVILLVVLWLLVKLVFGKDEARRTLHVPFRPPPRGRSDEDFRSSPPRPETKPWWECRR